MAIARTELPQRLLALELRFAIDDARQSGRVTKVRQLLEENPSGARSSHVAHNLGPERMQWLEDLQKEGPSVAAVLPHDR